MWRLCAGTGEQLSKDIDEAVEALAACDRALEECRIYNDHLEAWYQTQAKPSECYLQWLIEQEVKHEQGNR